MPAVCRQPPNCASLSASGSSVPALAAREIFLRKRVVNGRFWLAFLAVCVVMTVSAGYELIEWAAAVVMLLDPAALLGPSFQMSFAAVLALIAGFEALQPRFAAMRGGIGWGRRIGLAVVGLLLTSILAGAATAPFGLAHFGRLQWYGVAANALAVPTTSFLVMPAGMLAALLMPLGLEAPALWVMGLGVEAVLWVARLVAAWPGATQLASPIPAWGLVVFAFGFLLLDNS